MSAGPSPDDRRPESDERVILVDEDDREVGTAEKFQAHRDAARHRAFSVFVFDGDGAMLLQRRASAKYHSASLWSNACCGHPRPGETTVDAAHRRLGEEMGFDCELVPAMTFTYRAELGAGLSEHEIDHVFVGRSDADPTPNPDEVGDWRRVDVAALRRDVAQRPERYTVWFRMVLDRLLAAAGHAAPG